MEPVELHQGIRCLLKDLAKRVEAMEAALEEHKRQDDDFKAKVLEVLEVVLKGGRGGRSQAALGELVEGMRQAVGSSSDKAQVPATESSVVYPSLRMEPLFQIPSVLSEQISSSFSSLPSRRNSTTHDMETPLARRQDSIAIIHATFDTDGNGYISYDEASSMQEATEGTPLPLDEWYSLCKYLNVNPSLGLDLAELTAMYNDKGLETNLVKDYEVALKISGDSFLQVKPMYSTGFQEVCSRTSSVK